MDVYGCLWMFMYVYGCLWMFMDVYGISIGMNGVPSNYCILIWIWVDFITTSTNDLTINDGFCRKSSPFMAELTAGEWIILVCPDGCGCDSRKASDSFGLNMKLQKIQNIHGLGIGFIVKKTGVRTVESCWIRRWLGGQDAVRPTAFLKIMNKSDKGSY